jgi:hypothetical protein
VTLVPPGTPNIGYSDIANIALKHWLCDFPHILGSPHELAHVMPFLAATFGAAHHAAIGQTKPIFVEIGTQQGISTRALITAAAMFDGHVVSMDPDPNCSASGALKQWVVDRKLQDRWTHNFLKSQDVEPIQGASFLLVDGDHGYEAVCSDMARHGAAVRDGGVIVLDDYHTQFPGKQRWLQERWSRLAPFTSGPTAILVKRPGDEAIYKKDMTDGDSWSWKVQ